MKNLNWNTELDSSTGKMTITFSNRIKIEYFLNTGAIVAYKDGEVLDCLNLNQEDELLRDTNSFSSFLVHMANEARRLNQHSEC